MNDLILFFSCEHILADSAKKIKENLPY